MESKPTKYLALNQSRITDFMMCPRFYQLRHVRRLDRGAIALRIGSMTHKVLEKYTIAKENGEEFEPEPPEGVDLDEWEVVEKLFWAYYREYKDEDLITIQPEVKAKWRFGVFKTPKTTWEVWLIGTLDGIVGQGERRYLQEYKTCANLGAAQFDKFLNDFQVTTYLWLGIKALELRLDGALVTLLPKTKTPQPCRMTVARTAHQFQEWEKTVAYEVRNLIHCMENDYFPQRQTNCTKWNRACIFHSFCITGAENHLEGLEVRGKDYTDELRNQLMKGEVKHGKV